MNCGLPCLLQYGRTSPKRSEFFHQGSGYDTWDYLQLHAGPLKPLAGQAPIYQFLLEETTLYNEHFGQNNVSAASCVLYLMAHTTLGLRTPVHYVSIAQGCCSHNW
jgi:hypothetical protein